MTTVWQEQGVNYCNLFPIYSTLVTKEKGHLAVDVLFSFGVNYAVFS